jgi:hypothetical protein
MKRENQLAGWGKIAFGFGLLAFLPSLAGQELMILSWLGSMQVPVGLSAMLVGGVLFVLGKLQEIRNPSTIGGPGPGVAEPGAPSPAASPPVRPNVLSGQVEPNSGSRDRL